MNTGPPDGENGYPEPPPAFSRGHPHRGKSDPATHDSRLATLRRLGELAVGTFPGTILPNPLVSELAGLARRADAQLPFVEELAADIFMGGFTPKYLAAARIAADLLEGTLYARYFGIDCAGVYTLTDPWDFSALCARRAGGTNASRSVAGNGTVIEQAQILTTHNLAVLAGPVAITPPDGWDALARRAFTTVCRLTTQARHLPRPLPVVKNAAFAWRQMLFHLSLCPPRARAAVLDEITRDHPAHLAPAVAGLHLITSGGEFTPGGTAGHGPAGTGAARRFLGWTTGPHWLLRQ
ncbi:hypothetical protein [Kitasatospora aureofaciens]|uniref:hypothetical protein n=1 Tax=Kitasatospora aureofaciens TaxID=1894 RepID=UPI001C43E0AC|nr:hypothetical protein [Kitasatospora aureofaciens]MBV6699370.1 hypothetical protein [Kitasatospora aureofaciens]